jgi:F420-non-reducing hydrogenase iron-sulfur subunit
MTDYKPQIIAFLCNWCSYAGADKAGGQKLKYSPNIKLIRLMCSGRIDPQFILEAFKVGADGVMVLGCHPGDCHYRNGNFKTLKRIKILQKLLPQFGIHPDRLILDWVGAGESEKFKEVANNMAEKITKLGPLDLSETRKTEVV